MFLEVGYFALITLLAHTVLTLRVYAVTGKNIRIAGSLYGLTVVQLGLGVYLCVYSFLHPRMSFPSRHMTSTMLTRFCDSPITAD